MTTVSRGIGYAALATAGLVALAAAPFAMAEDAKPRRTKGVSIAATSTLPLAAQMPKLTGYALRLRTIVLRPGAVVGYHSHARHSVVAYMVSGVYTEHRDGQGIIAHKPGEQWIEGADVAHWSENRGAMPAILINVDLVAAQ